MTRRICLEPGCTREPYTRNTTGYCAAHNHRAPIQVGDEYPLSKVKTVKVPYPTSNSGVALSMPVTLTRAPWEDE